MSGYSCEQNAFRGSIYAHANAYRRAYSHENSACHLEVVDERGQAGMAHIVAKAEPYVEAGIE